MFGARLYAAAGDDVRADGGAAGRSVYAVSVQFLGRSIESWFDVRIETALDGGLNLGRTALDAMLKELVDKGDLMAASLALRAPAEHVAALNALREQGGVQEATLYSTRGRVLGFSGNEKSGLMPEVPCRGGHAPDARQPAL